MVLLILSGLSLKSFGQKLEENKVDDFTKKSVKRTSWETLVSTFSLNAHFRFSLVDGYETFDLKMMRDEVFSIDKDAEVMFMLDNNDVVKVQNLEYAITCKGCGATGFQGSSAEGIQAFYTISKDDIEKMKAHKVLKVRIYTNDGYIDNDVKEKNAVKIMACLNLL